MNKRNVLPFVAALIALPVLASFETYEDRAQAEIRSEVALPVLAAEMPEPPAASVDPHDESGANEVGHGRLDPSLDLPDRHDDMMPELRYERDGRPNSDGSPRMKDLINPDRRR